MKNRIIEAAEKRFLQYGFRKVTMDDLAFDLGISKKTLYKHFKNKEAIATAVVDTLHKDIGKLLHEIRKKTHDPVERFKKVITGVSRRITKIGSLFLNDIKKDIPDLWMRTEEFREKEIFEHIEGILKEGIRKGKVRNELNTKIAVLAYLGAIRMVIQPEVFMENKFSIEEAFDNIRTIFLKGIQK
jgi:AcrR family transcriptional regulator